MQFPERRAARSLWIYCCDFLVQNLSGENVEQIFEAVSRPSVNHAKEADHALDGAKLSFHS